MVSYGAASNLDDLIYLRGRRSRRHPIRRVRILPHRAQDTQLQSRSIEGAGIFSLGGNQLITGFNNLSTSVSGTITGDGSLIKTGSGTLTLSGHQQLYRPDDCECRRVDRGWFDRAIEPDDRQRRRRAGGSGTVGSTTRQRGRAFASGPGGNARHDDGRRQSRVPVRRALRRTGQSHDRVDHQCERHRFACRRSAGQLCAGELYVERNYTILTADGGLTGTFDALTTSGLPAGFRTSLSYTGNTAVLNLSAQLVPEPPNPPTAVPEPALGRRLRSQPPPLPTFTVNQLNVGNAIDDFFNNGGALPPACVPLFGLTGNNLTTRFGPAFRRSRDRRPTVGIPDHRPVPQPDARPLRRWPLRRRPCGAPGARLYARARQHAGQDRARLCFGVTRHRGGPCRRSMSRAGPHGAAPMAAATAPAATLP